MADTSSSSHPKSLFEIRRFDGTGFDLWKDRMQGILFLKDCDDALFANKPEGVSNADWTKINRKAVTYIKMAVTDDILPAIKGLDTAMAVWDKLKASYENTTPMNQVHLMRKLVSLELDESTPHTTIHFTHELASIYSSQVTGRVRCPGVKQGCPLSPTLFGLYIDEISDYVLRAGGAGPDLASTPVHIMLYADDIILLSETQEGLECHLRALDDFRIHRELTVNLGKTKGLQQIFECRNQRQLRRFLLEAQQHRDSLLQTVSDVREQRQTHLTDFFQQDTVTLSPTTQRGVTLQQAEVIRARKRPRTHGRRTPRLHQREIQEIQERHYRSIEERRVQTFADPAAILRGLSIPYPPMHHVLHPDYGTGWS
ncbi:hypothetical protein L7F22_045737 [Adiantum nelumboides]|nr:hypothetical protein [Adiantum nelumboides]